jgi:hypothetical protein
MDDKDYAPHESWCDTENNISRRCNCMASEYIEKIENLKKIIAKELNENDDFGSEFVMVNILREENKRLREALEHYAARMSDGGTARQALNKDKVTSDPASN